jgi:hypothetical protein
MALSVGQHPDDKELSYYAGAPSGYEWEVGWNPVVIDENTWRPSAPSATSASPTADRSSGRRRQAVPAQAGPGP